MSRKVTLPKEVAEAVGYYRGQGFSNASIISTAVTNAGVGSHAKALVYYVTAGENNSDELMRALVIGFAVDQTPEEQIREYWEDVMTRWENADDTDRYYEGSHDAILTVLGILRAKIEGVNG
jgi:hypothetical protein